MTDLRTERILRQHVQTDRLLGVEVVPRGTAEAVVDESVEQTQAGPSQWLTDEPPAGATTTQTPQAAEPLPVDQRPAALQAIDEGQVRGCIKCGLCQSRTQTVFGEGSAQAQIMFVGEGPGFDEDQSGRPFVGEAGQMLDKMIRAMGFGREDVYIANVVKCRPPGNRTPTQEEVNTCWDYLRHQIEIVRPQVIVALGGPATYSLLGVKGITRIRGTWYTCHHFNPPVPVMPTFHPSYVLRNYTRETRGKAWSDLQQVVSYVNG